MNSSIKYIKVNTDKCYSNAPQLGQDDSNKRAVQFVINELVVECGEDKNVKECITLT